MAWSDFAARPQTRSQTSSPTLPSRRWQRWTWSLWLCLGSRCEVRPCHLPITWIVVAQGRSWSVWSFLPQRCICSCRRCSWWLTDLASTLSHTLVRLIERGIMLRSPTWWCNNNTREGVESWWWLAIVKLSYYFNDRVVTCAPHLNPRYGPQVSTC